MHGSSEAEAEVPLDRTLGAAPQSMTDWPLHIKKVKATGYDGTITLEVFAPQQGYLLLSQDLLRRWWAEASHGDERRHESAKNDGEVSGLVNPNAPSPTGCR